MEFGKTKKKTTPRILQHPSGRDYSLPIVLFLARGLAFATGGCCVTGEPKGPGDGKKQGDQTTAKGDAGPSGRCAPV